MARKRLENAKKWFNQQLPFWGTRGLKVINPFLSIKRDEVDIFKVEYEKMIAHFIHD